MENNYIQESVLSMEREEQHKVCSKCRQTLPASAFHPSNNHYDGLQPYCKECNKIYNRERNRRKKLIGGGKSIVKDAPIVSQRDSEECDKYGLDKVAPRYLIAELRRRGYRGELEKVTIEKVKI